MDGVCSVWSCLSRVYVSGQGSDLGSRRGRRTKGKDEMGVADTETVPFFSVLEVGERGLFPLFCESAHPFAGLGWAGWTLMMEERPQAGGDGW